MSKTEDIVRIRHMADAARKVIELTKGCNLIDLEKDEKLALAIIRLPEITLAEAITPYKMSLCRNSTTR